MLLAKKMICKSLNWIKPRKKGSKPKGKGKAQEKDRVFHESPPVVHHEEFEFSEIFIHQILETIEFVLGSVSHTASYLRLWALSLAHSELATVFWDKIFFQCLSLGAGMPIIVTGLLAFIGFSGWFFATLLVINFMEALSAFLHALRLHWVEFQSKFYRGDGYLFLPLSYDLVLSDEINEDELYSHAASGSSMAAH